MCSKRTYNRGRKLTLISGDGLNFCQIAIYTCDIMWQRRNLCIHSTTKLLLRVVVARDTSLSKGPNILRHVSVLTSQQCVFFIEGKWDQRFLFYCIHNTHNCNELNAYMRLQTCANDVIVKWKCITRMNIEYLYGEFCMQELVKCIQSWYIISSALMHY